MNLSILTSTNIKNGTFEIKMFEEPFKKLYKTYQKTVYSSSSLNVILQKSYLFKMIRYKRNRSHSSSSSSLCLNFVQYLEGENCMLNVTFYFIFYSTHRVDYCSKTRQTGKKCWVCFCNTQINDYLIRFCFVKIFFSTKIHFDLT